MQTQPCTAAHQRFYDLHIIIIIIDPTFLLFFPATRVTFSGEIKQTAVRIIEVADEVKSWRLFVVRPGGKFSERLCSYFARSTYYIV